MPISALALKSQSAKNLSTDTSQLETSADLKHFLLCQKEFSMLNRVRAKRLNPPAVKES